MLAEDRDSRVDARVVESYTMITAQYRQVDPGRAFHLDGRDPMTRRDRKPYADRGTCDERTRCAMVTARRYPLNRQLTWEGLERGWSHGELCEQIKINMCDAGEADTGLTGNTVRRWETCEWWPDPRFRKYLVTLLGKPASQLGLLTPDELAARPELPEQLDPLERLLSMLGDQTRDGGFTRQRFLCALIADGRAAQPSAAGGGNEKRA